MGHGRAFFILMAVYLFLWLPSICGKGAGFPFLCDSWWRSVRGHCAGRAHVYGAPAGRWQDRAGPRAAGGAAGAQRALRGPLGGAHCSAVTSSGVLRAEAEEALRGGTWAPPRTREQRRPHSLPGAAITEEPTVASFWRPEGRTELWASGSSGARVQPLGSPAFLGSSCFAPGPAGGHVSFPPCPQRPRPLTRTLAMDLGSTRASAISSEVPNYICKDAHSK